MTKGTAGLSPAPGSPRLPTGAGLTPAPGFCWQVPIRKEARAVIRRECEASAEPCGVTMGPGFPAVNTAAPNTLISKPVPLFPPHPPPQKLPKDLGNRFDFLKNISVQNNVRNKKKSMAPSPTCLGQKNRPISCQFHPFGTPPPRTPGR